MSAIIQFLLEVLKWAPSIIQIIQAILEMLAKQGRATTVSQIKGTRDFYRAKARLSERA